MKSIQKLTNHQKTQKLRSKSHLSRALLQAPIEEDDTDTEKTNYIGLIERLAEKRLRCLIP
jgi:hypothetical protein